MEELKKEGKIKQLKELEIGKEYNFGIDGIVTLIKTTKKRFYIKVSNTGGYEIEGDGSVGFPFEALEWLTEIKTNTLK